MKILRTVGILALVAGLVLGGASSALAQGPPGKRGFFGTAGMPDGYDVPLTTAEGWTVEVTLTDTAKYMVPRVTRGPVVGLEGFEIALDEAFDEDITAIEGRRVAVLATNVVEDPPGYFTADVVRLMLIPSSDSPTSHAHRVGFVEVGAFDPSTGITIIDREGVSHYFTVSGDTVYRPSAEDGGISELAGDALIEAIEEGCVTVVTTGAPKLPNPIAKAIVLHDELPDWAP